MTPLTFLARTIACRWRNQVPVLLAVALGTMLLVGSLDVGASLRGSLRAAALDRLGRVSFAVRGTTPFRVELAGEMSRSGSSGGQIGGVAAALHFRGTARHPDRSARAADIDIWGVDADFWPLVTPAPGDVAKIGEQERSHTVVLGESLAVDLGVTPGQDVLITLAPPATISPDTLLGRRDEPPRTLRLTVTGVISDSAGGGFHLDPGATRPRNAMVPLATLQRAAGIASQVNTLLFNENWTDPQVALRRCAKLADVGLSLRTPLPLRERSGEGRDAHPTEAARMPGGPQATDAIPSSPAHAYASVESRSLLLPPPAEQAAREAAAALGSPAVGILSYLANDIELEEKPGSGVPYSTVAAVESAAALGMVGVDGSPAPELQPGQILLNGWTAGELNAGRGDRVRITYYLLESFGRLTTASATFEIAGVVKLEGAAADPGFTPDYPGVTDAENIADWQPPFPVDLRRIRPQDEAYWHQYRATPKAFVRLADGQRLWAQQHPQLGRLTSIRVYASTPTTAPTDSPATTSARLRSDFEQEFKRRLDPATLGLRVEPVRQRALAASRGTTDFGGLFVAFSFFLIVSAAMLVALFFRLDVDRRASQVGLLLAVGLPPGRIARWLLIEGTIVAIAGGLLGWPLARLYARLLLGGMQSWWSAALTAPPLALHPSLIAGAGGTTAAVVIALAAIAWSVRGLTRLPPRALLAGETTAMEKPGRRFSYWLTATAATISALAAVGLSGGALLSRHISQTGVFFAAGVLLLIAALSGLRLWLTAPTPVPLREEPGEGRDARHQTRVHATYLAILGIRNARRNPRRSLLTAGLVACATFLIAAMSTMRLSPPPDPTDRSCGTGGFTLLAETTIPLHADLNTTEGRETAGIVQQPGVPGGKSGFRTGAHFVPLRVHDGDDASCLNPYAPVQPRILGAPDSLIDRGAFAFSDTLAQTPTDRANPWLLLRAGSPDGTIPAIADESVVRWQLHLSLGECVTVTDERGQPARLRLVALLKDSVLAGSLIISDRLFVTLFASSTGYSQYLIDVPPGEASAVADRLHTDLAPYGPVVTPTLQRLADLLAVQNTYLSAFTALGGLGLLLGVAGLAAVLLRQAAERRRELALLRTLGFAPGAIRLLLWVENQFLVIAGLLAGLVSAAVASVPPVVSRGVEVPWLSLLAIFGLILLTGAVTGFLATRAALSTPLLAGLRTE